MGVPDVVAVGASVCFPMIGAMVEDSVPSCCSSIIS